LGRSTETSGIVSVDTAGARLPLADPLAGEARATFPFPARSLARFHGAN
jgi:hypothetical protein